MCILKKCFVAHSKYMESMLTLKPCDVFTVLRHLILSRVCVHLFVAV